MDFNCERKGRKYSVAEILEKTFAQLEGCKKNHAFYFYNSKLKIGTSKFKTFIKSGATCVACGLRGEYFVIERVFPPPFPPNSGAGWGLQLYGVKDGKEVLITKDHIMPKSKKGSNHIDNLQTMCYPCNYAKGPKVPRHLKRKK